MEAAREFDLIVCGGGPAGSTAAIAAVRKSPGIRVLMIEAGSFPRHKVCGEFFSPEAVGLLSELLGTESSLLSSAVPIERVGLHTATASTSFALKTPALSLTRRELDVALWDRAARLGVQCVQRTRVIDVSLRRSHFDVTTNIGQHRSTYVINATGRWSELSSGIEGRTSLIGIKAHFETGIPVPRTCDLHFFPGGYLGLQPITHTAVNASALVDATRYRDMESVLLAAGLREATRRWEPLFTPLTCPPVRFAAPSPVSGGVLNCGDAAAFIDPFAGDGMSLALHSGALAGELAADHMTGELAVPVTAVYEGEYLKRYSRAFRSAAHLRRFAFAPDWMQSLGITALRMPFVAQAALARTRAA